MKRIVFKKERETTIGLDEIPEDGCGIIVGRINNQMCIVIRERFGSGRFRPLSLQCSTSMGNGFGSVDGYYSIRDLIFSLSEWTFYLLLDEKELAKWILNQI